MHSNFLQVRLVASFYSCDQESPLIQKFQLGCIDCLAILLKIEFTYKSPTFIHIQNNSLSISSMLDLLVAQIQQRQHPMKARLAIFNVFIVVVKMLGETASEKYCKLVIPAICKYANSDSIEDTVRGACLQVHIYFK